MNEPKPMSAERMVKVREDIAAGTWRETPGLLRELLAHIDHQAQHADRLEDFLHGLVSRLFHERKARREAGDQLAALIEAAENAGDIEGIESGSPGVDALVNVGASTLVSALRAHPEAEHGIRCDVEVRPEGRMASVFVQWGDKASAVDVVAHIMRERELEADVKRLRQRCPVTREDVERAGVTRVKCEAYIQHATGQPLNPKVWPPDEQEWRTVLEVIRQLAVENSDRWRILDAMAAMEVE